MAWIEEAGWMVKAARPKPIKGYFQASILLNPPNNRKNDLDNRTKVLLDLAQKFGLIENDHLCRKLTVEYGTAETAPLGARLTLTAISSALTKA